MSRIEIGSKCLIIPLFFAFFLYSAEIQAQDLSTGDMKFSANAKDISRQYLDEGKTVSFTLLFQSKNGIENEKPRADGESENVDLQGIWGTAGGCESAAARGDTVYFGDDSTLVTVDFTNHALPVKIEEIAVGELIKDIVLNGNYAYVVDDNNGLHVIDISHPDTLFETDFLSTDGASGVAVNGNFAYVADRAGGLRVIEITDPENPSEAGYYDTSDEAMAIAISDDNIFSAMAGSGIYLFYTHLVPTLVQGYSAGFCNEAVKVEWELSEAVDISELAVYRGEFPGGIIERIQPREIKVYGLIYSFEDADCSRGKTYFYRVGIENGGCYKFLFETERISIPQIPLALHQSYPNPFNPSTTITYDLPEKGRVKLDIYDAAGRFVKSLLDRTQNRGSNKSVVWNGKDTAGNRVCSGVYFYRLRFGREELSRKMILLK